MKLPLPTSLSFLVRPFLTLPTSPLPPFSLRFIP
jgi:hypothetical protein